VVLESDDVFVLELLGFDGEVESCDGEEGGDEVFAVEIIDGVSFGGDEAEGGDHFDEMVSGEIDDEGEPFCCFLYFYGEHAFVDCVREGVRYAASYLRKFSYCRSGVRQRRVPSQAWREYMASISWNRYWELIICYSRSRFFF
jgi:hypothetical protein